MVLSLRGIWVTQVYSYAFYKTQLYNLCQKSRGCSKNDKTYVKRTEDPLSFCMKGILLAKFGAICAPKRIVREINCNTFCNMKRICETFFCWRELQVGMTTLGNWPVSMTQKFPLLQIHAKDIFTKTHTRMFIAPYS